MNREPAYIVQANIRSYQRLLADPCTSPVTREVVVKLLAEAREQLHAIAIEELDTVKSERR